MSQITPLIFALSTYVYIRTEQFRYTIFITPRQPNSQPWGCIPHLEKALAGRRDGENVVMGDFNLHHPAWGGIHIPVTDRNSEDLLSVVGEYGLQLLLKKGTITYEEAGHHNIIDLVFATPFIAESLISCKISQDNEYGSDHYPIITRFNLQTIQREEQARHQFKRTDIQKLRQAISEKILALENLDLDSTGKIDNLVQALVKAIQEAVEISTPMVKICSRSKPGFTLECKEAQMKARRLRKIFNRLGTEEAWEEYRASRLEAGYIIRKTSRKAYRESREEACDSVAKMWKAVRWTKNRKPRLTTLPALKIPSTTQYETNPKKKIELLRNAFFPFPPEADLLDIPGFDYPRPYTLPPIIPHEIFQAILRPSPHKAPGPTGIPNFILQQLISTLLPILHQIFNASLNLGYCLLLFRTSITIAMQKPHKDDYSITKAYRPIALLDTIGKALESVLAKRISALTELHGLLPKTHFGGRRGTSTEHAIHYLLDKTYKGWQQGKDMSSIMLDVTGAFDNVSHERLLHNLRKRRIDLKIVDWIASFISNRSTIIKTNERNSDNIHISTGIPQGSPLSPILYLFYNADLIEICCATNAKVTAG